MELRKIQYFLCIVESGSLSKAAERLYLTQPTLSRFLAKLEEEAGIKLFLRQKDSSLKLTEAGEVYLRSAREINKLWTSMETELDSLKKRDVHHIRLGIDSDSMHPFVQSCVNTVTGKYPGTSVEVYSLPSRDILSEIVAGRLDLGVSSYSRFDESLEYRIYDNCEVDLAVNKAHPLAKYSYQIPGQEDLRISLRDLEPNTPFLLMREGHALRELTDSYMQKMHFAPDVPSTYMRPEYLSHILNTKEALVGFSPRSQFFPELALIALDPPLFRSRGVCFRRRKELTPAESLLIDLLYNMPVTRRWNEESPRVGSAE